MKARLSRRGFLNHFAMAAGGAVLLAKDAISQSQQPAVSPTPRDYTPGAQPVSYPDPDILTVDPAFNALRVNNTAIQRLWTGGQWCEGPAWCGQGRYLLWSDIPNNRQMRWSDD